MSLAEDEAVEKVISIINDVHPENPSVSIIVHDENLKFLAGKIIGVGFFSDRSLKHIDFNATEADVIVYLRSQSFSSLMTDIRQDINRGFAFSRCLNGTFI